MNKSDLDKKVLRALQRMSAGTKIPVDGRWDLVVSSDALVLISSDERVRFHLVQEQGGK